jgi:hypothetical protein
MCEPFVTRQISIRLSNSVPNRPEHILVNTLNSCCDVKDADVVLTSRKNAWKKKKILFSSKLCVHYANGFDNV